MLALVLALLAALHAPTSYATAIAWVAAHDPPPAGMSRELGAAMLVVYGWEESRLAWRAKRGDGGRAVCAFQVHATGTRADQLEADPVACVRAAYAVMRESQRICGDLSGYCGACRGKAAKAIADRRAREAEGLLDKVQTEAVQPSEPARREGGKTSVR